jgi:hypothetical protein
VTFITKGVSGVRQTVWGVFPCHFGIVLPPNLGMSGKTNKTKGNLLTGSDKFFFRIKNPDPPIKS